jgi:hypothetical protein
MPKSRPKRVASIAPWWLSAGEDECPHCGQVYAYEVEFRCPDCDSPACPHCKGNHADGRLICLVCLAECGESEGFSHG